VIFRVEVIGGPLRTSGSISTPANERVDAVGIGIIDWLAVVADETPHRHSRLRETVFSFLAARSPRQPREAVSRRLNRLTDRFRRARPFVAQHSRLSDWLMSSGRSR
jgi:hypothetical protein